MPSFPWRPRMRGVTPAGRRFTVLAREIGPLASPVVFLPDNFDTYTVGSVVDLTFLDEATPDLDDEATVGAYIGAIKDRLNRDAGGWVVFPYYSSTRGRWRIEARKEGKEHRGEAKCLGEGFTRASALKAAWQSVNA